MSVTLDTFIQMVRGVHPAFDRHVVPDKALADFATREQRRLLTLGLKRDRQFMAQAMVIAFDLTGSAADMPGVAGAGTTGGVPVAPDGSGGYAPVQADSGSLINYQTDDVVTLVSDTHVASATTNTLTGTGVSWATNAYATRTVVIVAGTGYNQPPRTITSNTSDTLALDDPWAMVPDPTSVFQVVAAQAVVDQTFGVFTNLPSLTTQQGYLVRLDALGQPYIDLTKPLTVSLSHGVSLPPLHSVLGGTVRYSGWQRDDDYGAETFNLVSYAERFRPPAWPAGYLLSNTLYLLGTRNDWIDAQGIEVQYVPIPPAFTGRTDYFFLPDTALQAMVSRAALFAASRIAGLDGVPQPSLALLQTEASLAEQDFLNTVVLTRQSRRTRTREVW